MLLFGGQLVPQDIVTSSGVKIKVVKCLLKKRTNQQQQKKNRVWAAALSPLHKALQQAVKNVAPVPHQLDVLGRAVHTLPV